MATDEIAYMTAAEIAERVRRRALSPVEMVESCIDRIEAASRAERLRLQGL